MVSASEGEIPQQTTTSLLKTMTFAIKFDSGYTSIRKKPFTGSGNTLKSLAYNKTKSVLHGHKSRKQNSSVVAGLDKRDEIDPLGLNNGSKSNKKNLPKEFELDTADEILGNLNSKQESPLSIVPNVSRLDQLIGSKTARKEDTLLPWQRADEGGSDIQKAFSGFYDSTLADGPGSNGEQRKEGGSVSNFLINAGFAILAMVVGQKAEEAVKAAGIGSSTVEKAAGYGPGGLISGVQVATSDDTDQSLFESAVSTAVGVVDGVRGAAYGVWGAAVSIGLSGANEIHKETAKTHQTVCLAFRPYTGVSRADCLKNWGPNGKPMSDEKMEEVRDLIFNGKDPAKIAKEQWENKDPLINPGEGQKNDAESGSADYWKNHRGAICPFDETNGDPFEIERIFIADPSLDYLINPGEGGNNGGEGGVDEGGDPFSQNPFGQPSDNNDGTTTLF